jgi:hypothetical protein
MLGLSCGIPTQRQDGNVIPQVCYLDASSVPRLLVSLAQASVAIANVCRPPSRSMQLQTDAVSDDDAAASIPPMLDPRGLRTE